MVSASTPEPLCQVMPPVGNLDRAINFYEKVSCICSNLFPFMINQRALLELEEKAVVVLEEAEVYIVH